LDEADYLGDQVAILQAPGKLLALDNPVGLKHRLGKGFSLTIDAGSSRSSLLEALRRDTLTTNAGESRGKIVLSTGSNDVERIQQLVDRVARDGALDSSLRYQVNSSTLEDVFLDLNAEPADQAESATTLPLPISDEIVPAASQKSGEDATYSSEKDLEVAPANVTNDSLRLTPGHKPTLLSIPIDAWTIVRKRLLVLRRSWLLPLVAVIMVICATCIPLFFLGNRAQTCALLTRERLIQPLTYPRSAFPFLYPPLLVAPQSLLGEYTAAFGKVILAVPDNTTFVDTIRQDPANLTFGGISINPDPAGSSLFAWEGTAVLNKGLSALNLISNTLLNRITGVTGTSTADTFRINLDFQFLPSPSFLSTAQAMKWIAFL
jgi:ATP-binding cassette subfamily A (ABC1) protein 3